MEHKKMYKSGKQWVVAAVLTAGVLGGVVAAQPAVHADSTSQTE
jgi:hypothetical protein